MAAGLDDITLQPSGKAKLKLPKKFGASEATGSVVELRTNNPIGDQSFFWSFLTKKVLQNGRPKLRLKIF